MNATRRRLLGGLLVAVASVACVRVQAALVLPGWDLLETIPDTHFMGIPFSGVPLGSYDFGGTIGVQPVGSTDTIVQRLDTALVLTPPGIDTIPIELVALQLVSAVPIDVGAGLDFHYITLQSARGGPPSPGQMDVGFADDNGGTFDSFFDVFFDLRLGSLNGPIVQSGQLPLSSQGNPWNRTPPPGAVEIDDVNRNLNGTNNAGDIWPIGPIRELHPQGLGAHVVVPARVPEASAALLGVAVTGASSLAYVVRSTRRRR